MHNYTWARMIAKQFWRRYVLLPPCKNPQNEHYLRSVRCTASHTRRHATHTMLGPDTRQTSGTESPAKRRLFGVKWR
jgi:hypothetical protein